jgi:starch-binding outer membrane protein, SusD/RagB family
MNGKKMAGRSGVRAALPLLVLPLLASCETRELLEVDMPDQIPVDVQSSPVGARALRVSALGNFATFYAGDVGGSGVGVAIASGLLSDEMESARGGTEHLDSRAQIESNFPVTSPWSFAGQTTTQTIRAIRALRQYLPESTDAERATKRTHVAQLFALQGMAFVLLGENYCNGIPISAAADVVPQETEILSNAQLFNRAVVHFDTAIATAGTTAADLSIVRMATIGKARALVDLNRYDDAAALVRDVPSGFSYVVAYSNTSIINSIYNWMFATLNFAPADRHGGNGLDFVSARDPRITIRRDAAGNPIRPRGQDGLEHYVQTLYQTGNAGVPLATGVEARLIEAEAALALNDVIGYLLNLNAARATRGDLPPLTDPGTPEARRDLLFRERAFWMWGTAHRVGDLRRLVRQYGLAPDAVWPIGPYFKGGTFGTDMNLVPSQAERNNPDYKGCADRNA